MQSLIKKKQATPIVTIAQLFLINLPFLVNASFKFLSTVSIIMPLVRKRQNISFGTFWYGTLKIDYLSIKQNCNPKQISALFIKLSGFGNTLHCITSLSN